MAAANNLLPLATVSVPNDQCSSHPPQLPYSLRDRKTSIGIACILLLFDSCVLPLGLFYSLWFGTSLSPTNVFTVITSVSGVIDLFHFFWRLVTCLKNQEEVLTLRCFIYTIAVELYHPRKLPLGSKRGWLDSFQIIYCLGAAIVLAELVIGTAYSEPLVRLCSMPVPTMIFLAATFDICCTMCCVLDCRIPFRLNSMARGEKFRPGVYFLMEDIVAVDGNGGRSYRAALDTRYCASKRFRQMLVKLSFFWSVSALLCASAVTAVVFTASKVVAFGIGWGAPFIWAAVWAWVTIKWVQRMLLDEDRMWLNASM